MISAQANPPSRFESVQVEWEDAPPATLKLYEDHTQTVLSRNLSPDIPFEYSLNPYRGCFHACAYCYARSSHEYLGFGAGTDFDRKIVVKRRAPQLLEARFLRPSWVGDLICFSGNTDCYQPIEQRLGITRACLEVCLRYRNPVSIITKSTGILRDIELIAKLSRQAHVRVSVSIPFIDPVDARAIEPFVSPPLRRLAVVRALSEAGVPVMVSLSPVIPGLNESQIPKILEAAREAGAMDAWMTPIRLEGSVVAVFEGRLREAMPERADRVIAAIKRMRNGTLSGGGVGTRMTGHGAAWASTVRLFNLCKHRLGFPGVPERPYPSTFRVPGRGRPCSLFA
jgi:DNA repair photolyase